LKPSQIPSIPPTAVKNTEDMDKKPAPQRVGINPPMVEPINMKTQIRDFEFILTIILN
jgi:hypothetical protein